MSGTPRIIPGSICHLNAARAASGTGAGSNSVPTSEWYDLSGQGHHGTLTNFGYEAGNRPRTNDEADRAKWHDLSGNGNDGALVNLGWTEASGWATEPDRLVLDGALDYVSCGDLGVAEDKVFSYEVWHIPASLATVNKTLVGEAENDAAGCVVDLRMYGLRTYPRMYDGATNVQITGPQLAEETLYQQGFVADGETMQMYHQGAMYGSAVAAPAGALTLEKTRIGCLERDVRVNFYPGGILVVRLYGRVLTPSEWAQNYAAGPTGTDYIRAGLVLDLNAARAVRPSGWVEL